MNSNTHNQTSDNSPLSTPSIPPPIRLDIHLPATTYHFTTVGFETLSRQNAQYFFYLLDLQRNYPRSPT